MQEVFEKIINKLEEQKEYYKDIRKNTHCRATETSECDSCRADHFLDARLRCVDDIIKIVRQTAEQYNNGWIPCSEDNKNFPADCERVRVTLWCGDEFTGYRKDGKWFINGGNGIAEADVIAWQPTQPYQPSVDHKKKTNFDICCESMEAMAQIIDIAKIGWTKEQIIEWLQKEECEVPE